MENRKNTKIDYEYNCNIKFEDILQYVDGFLTKDKKNEFDLKINNSQHFCNKLWYHVISKK
jgi:hypothetical protein